MQPAKATWQALLSRSWRRKLPEREGGRRDGTQEAEPREKRIISCRSECRFTKGTFRATM
jgi:hypothetical protein